MGRRLDHSSDKPSYASLEGNIQVSFMIQTKECITCELQLKASNQNTKMEPIFIAAKEVLQDDKDQSVKLSDLGVEVEDRASLSASKLKMEFEKMLSKLCSNTDFRQPNDQICTRESCQCGNKLTSPESVGFVSPMQNLACHCIASAGNRASESLDICSRTSSLFNLSWNIKTSEILFEILKHQIIEGLGASVFNYSAASNPGNALTSTSGQWILDSRERVLIARALLKSSSTLHLGRDNAVNNVMSRSVNTRQIKSPELTSYPPEFYDPALQMPELDSIPFKKQKLKSIIAEEMLLSYSSSNSSCSHPSSSSAHHCLSMGMLRCVQKGGIPYFEFSLDDDLSEVFVASPQKMDPPAHKALDYVYLFLSRAGTKKDPRKRNNNALCFVGKMKVTSSLVLGSSRSKSIETEFVLVGAHDDDSKQMQPSTSTSTKSKGLSKKVSDIFKSKNAVKHKSFCKIGEPYFENFLTEEYVGELNDTESSAVDYLAHDFPPNLELAAIVVKDNRPTRKEEVARGGWGLKFLEKAEVSHADASTYPSSASKGCMSDNTESARNVSVVLPAGLHGGQITKSGGPSSLIERWRSGGHCDCGGWDIGCPITVLNNSSEASPHIESQDGCKLVDLFIEGTNGEPVLKMVAVNESLYHIYFQSSLSPLQSFSIGVAIIHTKIPDLYPKL